MSNIYWEEHLMKNEEDNSGDKKLLVTTSSEKIEDKVVGGYDITGNGGEANSIILMMTRKPNLFHRVCTRFFLGWVWIDKNRKDDKI